MESIKGRVHSYESFGTLDGPGLRFVVFLQGCPLRCAYCHNPDTWDPAGGMSVSAEDVVDKIEKCRAYLRNGGATISGGEPLLQPAFVLDILRRLREINIHSALDTAGTVPLTVSAPVIDASDMLLLDIKALDTEDCRKLTGQGNENTLATLDYCEKTGKRVWIRHVIVPGLTLDMDKLKKLATFLKPFKCVERTELLPFNKLGEFKWKALNIPYALADTPSPTDTQIAEANALFAPPRSFVMEGRPPCRPQGFCKRLSSF